MTDINKEIVIDIINALPEDKVIKLMNACYINYLLTSTYELSNVEITVYKEGWYVELIGTICKFSVFAKDNDGEIEITRKPNENKLHKLYWQCDKTDFINFRELM